MKKTLSWLIVLAMLVAMMPAVFATEEAPLTAGFVASDLGYENGTAVENIEGEVISFTFSDGGNSYGNCPKYYTTGTAIRFYNQNTLTISVAEGYEIVSVVITTESSKPMNADNTALTNATAEYASDATVLTPEVSTEDIVMAYTPSSGHWRIQAVEVTYVAIEAEGGEEGGEVTMTLLEGTATTTNEDEAYWGVGYETVAPGNGTITVSFFPQDYYPEFQVVIGYGDGEWINSYYEGILSKTYEVNAGDHIYLSVATVDGNGWYTPGSVDFEIVFTGVLSDELPEEDDVVIDTELEAGINTITILHGETFSPEYTFVPETDGMLSLEMVTAIGLLNDSVEGEIVNDYTDMIQDLLDQQILGFQIDGVDYTEPVAVTAGTPVIITMAQQRMYSMWGYGWEVGVDLVVTPSGEEPEQPVEPELPENGLVLGNNVLVAENGVTSEYTFTATQSGTLYLTIRSYSMNGVEYGENMLYYSWSDIIVNGVALDAMRTELTVNEGDVLNISMTSDGDPYEAWLYLSFESFYEEPVGSELNPIVLTPDQLPFVAPELAPGESLFVKLEGFDEYQLYVYGENAYIISDEYDSSWNKIEKRYDAVDGVVTYDITYDYTIEIGNAGDTAATFEIDGYQPLGISVNPDTLVIGEQTVTLENEQYAYYFEYIATEDGTLTIVFSGDLWRYTVCNVGNPDDWSDDGDYFTGRQAGGATDTVVVEVKAGDVVEINVGCSDADWNNVAGSVTLNASFQPAAGEEPVEPEVPANGLVIGDNAMDLEPNASFVEKTFTATEAGTVTFEFTMIGYLNTYGDLTEWDITERFATEGSIWFEGYINGERMADMYKGSIVVEAGDTVTVELRFVGNSYFAGKDRKATLNVSFSTEIEQPEDPEQPAENEFTVETTDTYGWFDQYTFTATEAGTYTFHLPAGLGMYSKEAYNAFRQPEVDYYDNTEGADVEVELAAGEEFVFFVAATTKGEWTITWTFVAGDVGGEGGEGGDIEPTENTLVLGTNAGSATDVLYSFIAEADGTLTIDASAGNTPYGPYQGSVYTYGSLVLEVNGVAVDGANRGVYEMEVTAGQVVTIKVTVGMAMYQGTTVDFVLSLAGAGEGGEDDPVVDNYNYQNLTIGNNNINGADIHWMFTASEAGTLTLNAGPAMFGDVTVTVKVNDGEAQAITPNSQIVLELQAGDVVKINAFATGYQTITAEWATEGSEEVCEHEFVDGVCVNCGEEDPNYEPPVQEPDGTQGNPFIIDEVPYEITFEATDNDGLYFQWTATEDGILYVYKNNGYVSISGAQVTNIEGGYKVEVKAGDVVKLNAWGGNTGFTMEFEVPTIEYIILENLNSVTVNLAAGETKFYKWVADKDGELTITLDSFTWGGTYLFTAKVNGESFHYTGSIVLNVQAGDELIFEFATPSYAGSGSLVFSGKYPVTHECNHVEVERVDASCTEDGYIKYECECGDSYTETLPATGHNYVDGTCGNCGEADPDYVPNTGSLNIMAIALIAAMSATAVVVTAKKRDEE